MKNHSLTLLEFAGQARNRKGSNRPPVDEHMRRVCLSPEAFLESQSLGFDAILPHYLVPSVSIQAELQPNWGKLEELIRIIDDYLPYGRTSAYALKVLLDTCMEKIIHLDEILCALKPREIFYFTTPERPFDFTLVFSEEESLYARLLPHVAAVASPGARLVALRDERAGRAAFPGRFSRGKNWLSFYYRLFKLGRSKGKRRRSVCLVEDGYGLRQTAECLRDEYDVIPWAPWSAWNVPEIAGPRRWISKMATLSRARKAGIKAWEAFKNDPRLPAIFSCRGVEFFPVISSRLEYLFTEVFSQLSEIEEYAAELFKRRRVACVASCYFTRPYTYALALAARRSGIPVVTMQHSSYGYWEWPVAKYTDGLMSNYKFVGGEGTARYVEGVERSGCKPLVTGLIPLDGMIGRPASPDPRPPRAKIAYPLASYAKNFLPFSNSRLSLTEYFEVNMRILEVLGKFPDTDVVVRPHPAVPFRRSARAIEEWAGSKGWGHVRFAWDGDTVGAMREADLVVIDSPSTVLLHAATTDAKILVFNRIFPMTAEGRASLEKRASYREDLDAFLALLTEVLEKRDFDNAPFRNPDFLRLYGTFLHDGNSLARTTEALRRVMAA